MSFLERRNRLVEKVYPEAFRRYCADTGWPVEKANGWIAEGKINHSVLAICEIAVESVLKGAADATD